jgi:hypothetical protein
VLYTSRTIFPGWGICAKLALIGARTAKSSLKTAAPKIKTSW